MKMLPGTWFFSHWICWDSLTDKEMISVWVLAGFAVEALGFRVGLGVRAPLKGSIRVPLRVPIRFL